MKKSQTSRMAFPFSILCLIAITALNTWAVDATYQYYRFTTTQIAGDSMIQVSEFDLINDGNKVDYTNLTVTNPGGNSPPNEDPPKIIDGDTNTNWLDFNIAPLVFTFNAPVTIDSYNFATANGCSRTAGATGASAKCGKCVRVYSTAVATNYPNC